MLSGPCIMLCSGALKEGKCSKVIPTGITFWYNRKHRRHSRVFQNRFKSIFCQEETYFLELVRYIHLNPIRARLVKNLDKLGRYVYCGHCALVGKAKRNWQDTEGVLGMLGEKLGVARRACEAVVEKGIAQGRRVDLTGGGLLRNTGGREGVKLLREEKVYQKNDEKILGDGDFVECVLAFAEEIMEKRYALRSGGLDLDGVALRVSEVLGLRDSVTRGQRIADAKGFSLLKT